MPGRAERCHDIGETFRQRVEGILKPLRYDILGSKQTFKCKCEDHHVTEHTVDTIARHLHFAGSSRRKTILIESKKKLPSAGNIPSMVKDFANKMDCLYKRNSYSEINEGLVFTDSNISLNETEIFERAAEKIASFRGIEIGLVGGSKFRMVEALSTISKQYSPNYSLTIIGALKKPDQDIGSLCPLNIGEIPRLYLCALKPNEFRINVFKVDAENYNSDDFLKTWNG